MYNTRALALTEKTVTLIANTIVIPIADLLAYQEYSVETYFPMVVVLDPRHTDKEYDIMSESSFLELYEPSTRALTSDIRFYNVSLKKPSLK